MPRSDAEETLLQAVLFTVAFVVLSAVGDAWWARETALAERAVTAAVGFGAFWLMLAYRKKAKSA